MSTSLFILLAFFVKSVIVLGLAGLFVLVVRRRSAALRQAIWNVALVGVLALPALALVLPGMALPDSAIKFLPWNGPVPEWSEVQSVAASEFAASYEGESLNSSRRVTKTEGAPAVSREAEQRTGMGLVGLLFGFWATGFVLLVAHLGVGLVGVWRIERTCRELDEMAYHQLLEQLCKRFDLSRRPRLMMTDKITTPMTWGIVRPVIVLPEGARSWPESVRRFVLAHELAHVRRWDVLSNVLSRLACAFYWINPLVWVAAHRRRIESEYACDDLVLSIFARPVPYCEALLEIARSSRYRRQLRLPVIEMARRSELERRLRAVLNRKRVRTAVSRKCGGTIWGMALCVMMPLAAFRPMGTAQLAVPQDSRDPSTIENYRSRSVCEQDRWDVRDDEDVVATRRYLLLLQSTSTKDREEAVRGLGNVGTREAVPALTAALDDPSGHVRQGAAGALGNLGDPRALEELVSSLDDPDAHVQQAAAGALGDLHDTRALGPLFEALRKPNKHVRQTAALALGRIGDRRAADSLAVTLTDVAPHVRAAGAQALGQIGARTFTEPMIRLFSTSEDLHVRLAAARSLGQFGDMRGMAFLINVLQDAPEQFTRADAAWALGAIGRRVPEAEEALLATLSDESRFVQYASICSLGRIGSDVAEERLRLTLRDEAVEGNVGEGIVWALQELSTP